MARITKLDEYLANHSAESMMSAWNAGGETRELLILEIGYANEGALYNALKAAGYIVSAESTGGDKPARSKPGKVRGCLPMKTALAVARALGLDAEEVDIGWNEFKAALSEQCEPDNWLGLLFHRLGGENSGAGVEFRAWIDSNTAIDAAKAAAELRANDPTIALKEKIKGLNAMLDSKENEIAELKEELERERNKPRSNGRVNRGGELTEPMLKLLKQRFHPDKQNGNDPELYNGIMQWLNAIEL